MDARSFLRLSRFVLVGAAFVAPAHAQVVNNSSGAMWGTSAGGVSVNGATDSAYGHLANSNVAGAARAARKGMLGGGGAGAGVGGGSITIQSIGSQSIVSNSINGTGNVLGNSSSQTTSNSGAVSNQGAVSGDGSVNANAAVK